MITDRQYQAWELSQEHGRVEAARIMGISRKSLDWLCQKYLMGGDMRYGDGKYARQMARWREAEAQVVALQARVDELEAIPSVAHLVDRLIRVEAKVDRLLARPMALDNRRIADGGRRRRQQMREAS